MKNIIKYKNENDFNEDEQQLVIANGRKGVWAAIVVGFDETYKYKREFLEEVEIFQNFYCYKLEEGHIYNWSESGKQHFAIVENKELYEISEEMVSEILNNPIEEDTILELVEIEQGEEITLEIGGLNEITSFLNENYDVISWVNDGGSEIELPNLSEIQDLEDLQYQLKKIDLGWWELVVREMGSAE